MVSALWQSLRDLIEERFFRYIDQRFAPQNEHTIGRKNLYIFPSRRGWAFIGIILILWLLGTNYQNNLVLALAFLLTSVFVVAILQTHANLSALAVAYAGVAPVHAGNAARFTFVLTSGARRFAENLEILWQHEDDSVVGIDVPADDKVAVVIPAQTFYRGWFAPGRMCVQSTYPLGLLRCWTWLNWDVRVLVYPEAIRATYQSAVVGDNEGDGLHPLAGGQDYAGLRNYTPGDPLKRISWKHFAQGKGVFVKDFSQNLSQERWLDLEAIAGDDLEQKLSALCYWAIQFDLEDEYYGMRLPDQVIVPDKGEAHRRRVLEALASYTP